MIVYRPWAFYPPLPANLTPEQEAIANTIRDADKTLYDAVQDAVGANITWEMIATILHITVEEAQQRFSQPPGEGA